MAADSPVQVTDLYTWIAGRAEKLGKSAAILEVAKNRRNHTTFNDCLMGN